MQNSTFILPLKRRKSLVQSWPKIGQYSPFLAFSLKKKASFVHIARMKYLDFVYFAVSVLLYFCGLSSEKQKTPGTGR